MKTKNYYFFRYNFVNIFPRKNCNYNRPLVSLSFFTRAAMLIPLKAIHYMSAKQQF